MTDNELLLQDRLQKIQQIIRKYGEENFYISFSGGKDSTVVHELVDMALPNNQIPRVYANTGIELNMIRDFVFNKREKDDRFYIIKPSASIKKTLEEKGYPFKSKEHSRYLNQYQNNRLKDLTTRKYIGIEDGYGARFRCPQKLKYQFSDSFTLKCSDKCCLEMKEKPLYKWGKENKKNCRILGIMPSEGGRRVSTKCLAFKNNGKIVSFHPLAVVDKNWEEWFIEKYSIEVCAIYYPPYNFDRTGCKGCPFNIYIQDELETLEKYFPRERKQCEAIWKPVYDEYRRIGYRLKPLEEGRQMEMDEFI